MNRHLVALLIVIVCAAPSWAASGGGAPAAPVVLVVGDSLSAGYNMRAEQGWVALLATRIAAEKLPHRVVNAAISGDTTQSGVGRLPRALERHRPAVVVIELGANDGLRGIPLATTRANLTTMVRASLRAGARVLLVGVRLPTNYGSDWGDKFHAMYSEIAAAEKVALLPLFVDERIATSPDLMQADGLHPAPAAQPLLLEKVWPLIHPLLRATRQNTAAPAPTPAGR